MPDARAARPASLLPCLHDTAGGRSLGEQTTTVQEFIENLECDFLEDSHSGWEDGEGSHGDGRVLDLTKRETVASIDCADWLAHQLTDPGELAGHRWREATRKNGPQFE